MLDALPHKTAVGPRGFDMLKFIYRYYRDPLGSLGDAAREYGDITLFQAASYTFFQITHPDHIKYVLQDNNRNYHIGGVFDQTRPVTGRGLATNQGDDWLWARRIMQPLFGRGQVAAFAPMVTRATNTMLERWHSAARDGQAIRLYPELLALNHHILGEMLFNVDLSGEGAPVLRALNTVREYTNRRINALVTVPTHLPTPRNRRFWSAVCLLDNFSYGLIHAARGRTEPSAALLSLLMNVRDEKTGAGMTDVQLHDELMTLFFAAYEDPANALAWALAQLTHDPAALERLRAEVNTVLNGRVPTYEDLPNLAYTGAVVEETLRLYPPTWSLLRDVVEDDVIDGCPIPRGSSILVNIYLAHRLPDYWANPVAFYPDRFLPGAADYPRYAYLPFGGGPRQCIAAAFALMQMKLMLAMVIQRYEMEWVSAYPVKPSASHSLCPAQDITVRLREV